MTARAAAADQVGHQHPLRRSKAFPAPVRRKKARIAEAVGERERHEVLIERRRQLLYAGFRRQVGRVFIDGQLLSEYLTTGAR